MRSIQRRPLPSTLWAPLLALAPAVCRLSPHGLALSDGRTVPLALVELLHFDAVSRSFAWKGVCPHCGAEILAIGRPDRRGVIGRRTGDCCGNAAYDGYGIRVTADAWPAIRARYFRPRVFCRRLQGGAR